MIKGTLRPLPSLFGTSLIIIILTVISLFQPNNVQAVSYEDASMFGFTSVSSQDHGEHTDEEPDTHGEDAHHSEGEHHAEGDHGGGHDSGTDPLFFIITALIIGAATRHFLKKSPLPFTVMLLLIGLGLGVLARLHYLDSWSLGGLHLDVSFVSRSVDWAANIDPHLLLFVFLPILIFEAAFAMDVHTFKKTVTNAVILAVPGIVLAMFLTAAIVMGMTKSGLGLETWGWPIALMFGAVISATDPVAVVALLKELGASKKLGTLIEGESLLNDGTAIVIFMVFFLGITGAAPDTSPIVEFFRVALGGTLVGLVIGWIVLVWLKRVVNDALVEISVVVAAAYLTFLVAEHFLHVSGVLALVALGLVMAGIGRGRISPHVEHFMHEFWELAGFIANCLIFLIVGVVIAERSHFALNDFLILGLVYVAIHVVRFVVIAVFFPVMRKSGYGMNLKEATIVWYGALRGAIGLALALIVAGVPDEFISQEIKDQFLFLTAGIVTLTLLVNATTIGIIVKKLGMTKLSPAKLLMMQNAYEYLRTTSENQVDRLKSDRYMKRADFDAVGEYLPETPNIGKIGQVAMETVAETRRRLLEREKSSYWHQFKDGLLSAEAVRKLSDSISEVLDEGGMVSLAERKDFEDTWETPKYLEKLSKLPVVGKLCEGFLIDRMAISYDCAVGFITAQEEALKMVESMHRSGTAEETQNLPMIESEINENKIHGQTYIRNLRKNYPAIYTAISTRQAIRATLSYERKTIERLEKKGIVNSGEAHKMINDVDKRAKHLVDYPPEVKDAPLTKNAAKAEG